MPFGALLQVRDPVFLGYPEGGTLFRHDLVW